MARKKRIWYPGAVYHITNRGNRRSDIFRDEEDYEAYLQNLVEVGKRHPFEIYSYCLMTNHVHLQLETKDVEIWHIMKDINQYYTKYFNDKYNLVGHLFEGRYKSELIESDKYNLETSRYIHLNPFKADMVKTPIEYKWSSYRNYMGSEDKKIINEDKILTYFKNKSRILYKNYVESKLINWSIDKEIELKMEDE